MRQQGRLDWLRIIGLIIGIAGLASVAAANDIPREEETFTTLVEDEGSLGAEVPEPTAVRIVPRLEAVDAATHQAMKARAQLVPAPLAQSLPEPTGPEPRVSVGPSFLGLSQGTLVPPDTIVAKSNIRVLEAVNTSMRLFTTAGGVLSTSTLNAFFGTGNPVLFDPKVYYDRNAVNRRFYVVALQGTSTALSRLWLAVSRSSDPPSLAAGNWCRYFLDVRRNLGTALASWGDYPGLGIGADKVVITLNNFTNAGNFTFAIVRVLNKLIAANNAGGCPGLGVATFQPSGVPGSGPGRPFTMQPAQHYTSPSSFAGTSNPVYLMNTRNGTSNYEVWRVRNLAPVSLQGPVTIVGNFPHSVAPDAPQQGSAVLLDTGGSRLLQLAGRGNFIAGVNGTGCSFGAGNNVSCVRFARVLVGQNAAGGLTAAIVQQNTFGFGTPAGTFVWMPGVALNTILDAVIPFQRNRNSAGVRFLSGLVSRQTAANAITNTFFITNGTCAQTFDRTGDYVGAQTDPSNNLSFWVAAERATVLAGSCQWQTQILRVNVP
jgi:hypothetical protein